ncbi:MAG TPA: 50S ribosomal protein L18 [Planctomycetaceae bacterium]|nr:50S ribosomal protein L18 [Planctomycetaceae bacterium]
MRASKKLAKRRERRNFRVRNQVRRSANGRPRLSVFRSNKHIYVQIIDDTQGITLVSASTVEKSLGGAGSYGGNRDCAEKIGKAIAERALDKGIKEVIFDRGSCQYHGRIRVLAEAAREGGLHF